MLQMHKNIRNFYCIVYNKTFISLINFALSREMEMYRNGERWSR